MPLKATTRPTRSLGDGCPSHMPSLSRSSIVASTSSGWGTRVCSIRTQGAVSRKSRSGVDRRRATFGFGDDGPRRKPSVSGAPLQRLYVSYSDVETQRTGPLRPRPGGSAKKRRIAIMVEPSPFSHVSGMRNRFLKLIEGLRNAGDEVLVFTPDDSAPDEWMGAKVVAVTGFPLPFYPSDTLRLSPGIDAGLWSSLEAFKPDLLHVSSPGLMVFAAIALANFFTLPLVVSYHTHVPQYIPKYAWEGIVEPSQGMMWGVIRMCSNSAAITLVTSSAMQKELQQNGCRRVLVWQKGIDTDTFHPNFRSKDMRRRMHGLGSDAPAGAEDAPIITYIGRLGSEKNLNALKDIMAGLPEPLRRNATLALVGDGPSRADLEKHFEGTRTVFTGMMHGDDLAAAYASADIFVMPSETETLGFVVLEAMASGLPVVAVGAGGLLDIIDESKGGGVFYAPEDYSHASSLVADILNDKNKRENMSSAARQEVMQWSWQAATEKLRTEQYTRAVRHHRTQRIATRLLRRLAPQALLSRIFAFLRYCWGKVCSVVDGSAGLTPRLIVSFLFALVIATAKFWLRSRGVRTS